MRQTLRPDRIRAELRRRDVRLGSDDALLAYTADTFGIRFAEKACCAQHQSPAEAFCQCYFARSPVTIVKASRAFGGKTVFVGALGLVESVTLDVDVTVLAGSGQQSARVLDTMRRLWDHPNAPLHLLRGLPELHKTRFRSGHTITALTASQTAVRGAHPARLRIDEADEMDLGILEAAQGQPMDRGEIRAHTLIASTHQYPDGVMTAMLKRAVEQDWAVFEWCYRENLEPAGWLAQEQVRRKRTEVTAQMWATEFELQEPTVEGRAIDTEAVEWTFDPTLGVADAVQLENGWADARIATMDSGERHWYAHGADWAQKEDYTVIATLRCDLEPMRLVAATRLRRRPWPEMIERLHRVGKAYPGPVAHDATGGGNVVANYVELRNVTDFQMVGRARRDLFTDYIAALERREIKMPRLEPFYREHKYCSVDDLYGNGHPPDTVVACALAYHAYKTGRRPGDYGISI